MWAQKSEELRDRKVKLLHTLIHLVSACTLRYGVQGFRKKP